jgi:hypothetical protein
MLKQRGHQRILVPVERPLVLPDHDRVPPPLRIRQLRHQGSGLRAPRPGSSRDSPVSKNSAVITPAPAASITACCNCRARDVTGSCQSSVDTRP